MSRSRTADTSATSVEPAYDPYLSADSALASVSVVARPEQPNARESAPPSTSFPDCAFRNAVMCVLRTDPGRDLLGFCAPALSRSCPRLGPLALSRAS
jgi:hypothetical protein